MTSNELNRFAAILKTKQTELENASHNRGALAIDAAADELDRTQGSQERELAIGTLDRGAKLLLQVRAAQSRIAEGSFGVCIECEEEIALNRLSAVPWAASCIGCQEASDNRAGQPALDHTDTIPIAPSIEASY
jgi:DnaK suppressor protein